MTEACGDIDYKVVSDNFCLVNELAFMIMHDVVNGKAKDSGHWDRTVSSAVTNIVRNDIRTASDLAHFVDVEFKKVIIRHLARVSYVLSNR